MTGKVKTLLVGTTLAPESDAVVADALALSRAVGARLRCAHAYLSPLVRGGDPMGLAWVNAEVIARHQSDVRDELAAQAARLGVRAGESAGLALSMSPAHRMLVEEAREVHADLIVVGGSERRGAGILGSTADRVLRKATCPLLVRRRPLRLPWRRLLTAVDLSPLAADTLRFLGAFLGQLGGAVPAVEVLFVLPRLLPGQLPPQFSAEQVRRFAADELERFVKSAGGLTPHARLRVLEGEPAEQITRAAAESEADLVVVGTHGRGGFERFLAGSVAAEVVRAAPGNVLVVPPEAALAAALADEASRSEVSVAAGNR